MWINWKKKTIVIRHIIENLEIFSDDSDESDESDESDKLSIIMNQEMYLQNIGHLSLKREKHWSIFLKN